MFALARLPLRLASGAVVNRVPLYSASPLLKAEFDKDYKSRVIISRTSSAVFASSSIVALYSLLPYMCGDTADSSVCQSIIDDSDFLTSASIAVFSFIILSKPVVTELSIRAAEKHMPKEKAERILVEYGINPKCFDNYFVITSWADHV